MLDHTTSPPTTIVHKLTTHATERGNDMAFSFLNGEGELDSDLDYQTLLQEANSLSKKWQNEYPAGCRIILILPTSPEFVIAFMACLLGGFIAVPMPKVTNKRGRHRLREVIEDCQPELIVCDDSGMDKLSFLGNDLATEKLVHHRADSSIVTHTDQLQADPDSIAFLQYTSGTTGQPKGVCISHKNLSSNLSAISSLTELEQDEVSLSWLPLYHDFGLVAGVLRSIWQGNVGYLIAPAVLHRKPELWPKLIDLYQVTVSSSTNSFLAACAKSLKPETDVRVDSLNALFIGGEFVSADNLVQFNNAFVDRGLQEHALRPIYGMAETTLAVTTGGGINDQGKVHCGRVIQGHTVTIDAQSKPPNQAGEILISGDSVSLRYFNSKHTLPTITCEHQRFLRSGDIGYFDKDDNLIIHGRTKNLIVSNSENFYAEEIESVIAHHIRTTVMIIPHSDGSDDGFIIFAEISEEQTDHLTQINNLRRCLTEEYGLEASRVILTRKNRLPRTSSGKLQRHEARRLLEENRLPVAADWNLLGNNSSESNPHEPAPTTRTSQEIATWLKDHLASALQTPATEIDEDLDFVTLGLDSAYAVSIALELEDFTGLELSASVLFEHPTINRLSSALGRDDT